MGIKGPRGGHSGTPEAEILRRLAEKGRTDIKLVWYAGGTQKPSKWLCLNGHGEFYRPANEILNRHGRCKKCSDKRLGEMRRLSEETLRGRLADREDVTLVTYSGRASSKSTWQCPQGHEWEATAVAIQAGGRCPYCPTPRYPSGRPARGGAPPSLTEQEVLDRLAARDDVTLINYAGKGSAKSRWACSHGHEWDAEALRVIAGGGCPACATARTAAGMRHSEEEVRQRIVDLGRDADVELVWYAGAAKDPASIWKCKHCGETWTARAGHVLKRDPKNRPSSCPHCAPKRGGKKQRLTAAQVRDTLTAMGRDDVRLVRYGGTTKVNSDWVCPDGHTWTTAAANVLKGSGCWDCSGRGFPLTEEKVRERLSRRTDIVLIEYGGSVAHHPSTFRCVAEGHEWATPALNVARAINPSGCPGCQTSGFSPGLPAWVYLLHHPEHFAIKVGITNDPDHRIGRQHNKTGWLPIKLWPVDGWDAKPIETAIVGEWRAAGYPLGRPKGTDGYTETVSTASVSVSEVLLRLEQLVYEFAQVRALTPEEAQDA